jgi:hypothetical protein
MHDHCTIICEYLAQFPKELSLSRRAADVTDFVPLKSSSDEATGDVAEQWLKLNLQVVSYLLWRSSGRHGENLEIYSPENILTRDWPYLNTYLFTPCGLGGLVVSMLASGTQDRGFTPGRSLRIFSGEKNPQHAFLRKGSKAVCPMSQICGMSKNPITYRGSRKL